MRCTKCMYEVCTSTVVYFMIVWLELRNVILAGSFILNSASSAFKALEVTSMVNKPWVMNWDGDPRSAEKTPKDRTCAL